MKIDDNIFIGKQKITVEENKHGTIRVNGKTEREMLKEYREKYGEEKYERFKAELEEDKKIQEKVVEEEK